tara:strand:+ start:329 stop:559 length:231 start_codon:yes stop_codon:yes gene_type:complete
MAVKDKRSRLLRKAARKKRQAQKRRDRGWPQAARRSELEAYELKRKARDTCGRGRRSVYNAAGKKVGCRVVKKRNA